MEEFGKIRWLHGTYEELKENIDKIPIGAICFCEDIGKIYVKVDNSYEEVTMEDIPED